MNSYTAYFVGQERGTDFDCELDLESLLGLVASAKVLLVDDDVVLNLRYLTSLHLNNGDEKE